MIGVDRDQDGKMIGRRIGRDGDLAQGDRALTLETKPAQPQIIRWPARLARKEVRQGKRRRPQQVQQVQPVLGSIYRVGFNLHFSRSSRSSTPSTKIPQPSVAKRERRK